MVCINCKMVCLKWPDFTHRNYKGVNWIILMEIPNLNKKVTFSMIQLILRIMKEYLLIPDWINILLNHQCLFHMIAFHCRMLILSNIT
jgi:hypothetical protein